MNRLFERSLIRINLRSLHFCGALGKGQNQRVKIAVAGTSEKKVNERRTNLLQMKAAANRELWLKKWEKENELKGMKPNSNVYFIDEYEKNELFLSDALHQVRLACAPSMFDCMENSLIVKKEENQEEAINAGAVFAGAKELLSKFELGSIHWEEYDSIVSHPLHEKSVNKLKSTFKSRIPNFKNGRMGENVVEMIKDQLKSVLVTSNPIDGVPEINQMKVVIGQPSWSDEKILENLMFCLKTIEENRSSRILGDTILEASILAPPMDIEYPISLKDVNESMNAVIENSSEDTANISLEATS